MESLISTCLRAQSWLPPLFLALPMYLSSLLFAISTEGNLSGTSPHWFFDSPLFHFPPSPHTSGGWPSLLEGCSWPPKLCVVFTCSWRGPSLQLPSEMTSWTPICRPRYWLGNCNSGLGLLSCSGIVQVPGLWLASWTVSLLYSLTYLMFIFVWLKVKHTYWWVCSANGGVFVYLKIWSLANICLNVGGHWLKTVASFNKLLCRCICGTLLHRYSGF